MNKFRKIFSSSRLPDTAKLLSVTPFEEKPRLFLFLTSPNFDVPNDEFTASKFRRLSGSASPLSQIEGSFR